MSGFLAMVGELTLPEQLMAGVQLLLLAAGCWALFRQWRSPRGLEEVSVWRTDFGSVALLVFLIVGGFFLVAAISQVPFVTVSEQNDADGTLQRVHALSVEGSFFSTLLAQLFVAGWIFFLMSRLQPGFTFNFPRLQKKSADCWGIASSALGAIAVVFTGILLTYLLLAVLGFYGIELELPRQSPVEQLLKVREQPWGLLLAFGTVVVGAPVAEELFFRGCLYRYFKGLLGRCGGVLVLGVIFSLVHANVQAFLPLTLLGAYLCVVYERTGDIRVPMAVHALFNLNTFLLLLLVPGLAEKMSP